MLPPLPGETALALLEDASDACAVFDRDTTTCLWQNAAWGHLSDSLQQLERLLGTESHGFMDQQLAQFLAGLSEVPMRQPLKWCHGGDEVFQTPLLLRPYHGNGRRLVAVLAMGPRPAVSLPHANDSHHRDPLTGLPGRGAIEVRLRQFTHTPHSAAPFALLFLDLNGFKQVNDQWGHSAGDRVLAVLASRLAGAIRDRDLIARYGGDEFVVLVDGIQRRRDLEPVLTRLRLAAAEPVKHDNTSLHVSASIGAALSSEGWSSIAELINAADQRMYAEKQHVG